MIERRAHPRSFVVGVNARCLEPAFRRGEHPDMNDCERHIGDVNADEDLGFGVVHPLGESLGHVVAPFEGVLRPVGDRGQIV